MRAGLAVGVILVLLGLATLYLLRAPLLGLIIFVFEFLGIIIGFLLLVAGLALIIGTGWMRRGPIGQIRVLQVRRWYDNIARGFSGHLRILPEEAGYFLNEKNLTNQELPQKSPNDLFNLLMDTVSGMEKEGHARVTSSASSSR